MKQDRFAWVTIVPTAWILICTLTAGWQKIFHSDPHIGFLAHADSYKTALAEDRLLSPAKSMGQMEQVIFNDYLNATLASIFIVVVISIGIFGIKTILRARAIDNPSTQETRLETEILTPVDTLSHVK